MTSPTIINSVKIEKALNYSAGSSKISLTKLNANSALNELLIPCNILMGYKSLTSLTNEIQNVLTPVTKQKKINTFFLLTLSAMYPEKKRKMIDGPAYAVPINWP